MLLSNHFQAFLAFGGGHQFAVTEEVGIRPRRAAPHPSAQLVELRQAKGIGAVYNQGVGVGDVEAAFDDGGGEQHVNAAFGKIAHHLREFTLVHLTMPNANARLRNELLQVQFHRVDGLHAVVDKEDLPAALQFAQDGLAYQFGRIRPDVRHHRQAFFGRGVEGGNIAHARERHVERARDGRRGQGQHVHFGAQLLEVFLVRHAEALLFVNDDQPQILELDILRNQAVGADDDIHLAEQQPAQNFWPAHAACGSGRASPP